MKKLAFVTLFATIALAAASLPVTSLAADSSGSSNGTVSFKAGNGGNTPQDPTDPGKENPGKPAGEVPGTTGPLAIDFVSNFDFGSQDISSQDEDYYAAPQKFTLGDGSSVDRPNYIQITDERGTFEGWNLKVKQNGQFKAGTRELDGAKLSFNNADAVSTMDNTYAPQAKATFDLTPDATDVLPLEAGKNQGMGTWVYRFGQNEDNQAKSVKLNVPGKTPKLAQAYTTTLTWSLEAAPSNTPAP